MTTIISLIVVFGFGFIVGRLSVKKAVIQETKGGAQDSTGEKITELE